MEIFGTVIENRSSVNGRNTLQNTCIVSFFDYEDVVELADDPVGGQRPCLDLLAMLISQYVCRKITSSERPTTNIRAPFQ